MVGTFGSHDWRDRKVREWLLLVLRFAVTRDLGDHSAVLAMADELDSLGGRSSSAAPSFFRRTSTELCEAILLVDDGHDNATLRKHVERIEDIRLRRAFQAAVGFQQAPQAVGSKKPKRRKDRAYLWKSLPKGAR